MNFFGYYVLNLEPTVLAYIGDEQPRPDWLQPKAVIEHIPWWHGSSLRMLRRKLAQRRVEKGGVVHQLLVHAPDEDRFRARFRVKGAFISQNIYIDQTAFSVGQRPRLHDALYVAQLKPFKRYELMSDIPKAFIVTGAPQGTDVEAYRRLAPNATFLVGRLSKVELAAAMTESACTLALSAIEGGMLASFESLLCGVPVVSTPSKGGRDVFFDEGNSRIVDPTPSAVARAVEHFASHPVDANAIRARAIEMLDPHRTRFCQLVSDLCVSLGGKPRDAAERYESYFGRPEGLFSLFVWADKLTVPSEVERIQRFAPAG